MGTPPPPPRSPTAHLRTLLLAGSLTLPAQESAWLKRKLEDNAYVFGEHLDAPSRYIAAKAPRVLPTSGPRGAVNGRAVLRADAIDSSLRDGGSYSHQWDKSAGCKWNPVYCKI